MKIKDIKGWTETLKVSHRHINNIDCLRVSSACLVCFLSTVNGRIKKERKKKRLKPNASSEHRTILKQSIFLSFDIYEVSPS